EFPVCIGASSKNYSTGEVVAYTTWPGVQARCAAMARCFEHPMRSVLCAGFTLMLLTRSAIAGPPYVSDDPEPTDYRHFEIYTFSNGTATRDGTTGASGIDFNY